MRNWELPAINNKSIEKTYDFGIVLSGMGKYDPALNRFNFFRSSDRLWQTITLYKQGIIKKIIISGGSGSILHPNQRESVYLRDYLITIDIPKSDILID